MKLMASITVRISGEYIDKVARLKAAGIKIIDIFKAGVDLLIEKLDQQNS